MIPAPGQGLTSGTGHWLPVGVPVHFQEDLIFCWLLFGQFSQFSVADGLFVGFLTSQQHASVSQGRIGSDNFTCCHTVIEVADQTFHLNHPQYTDTGPTSPSIDPIMPGTWQGSHWSVIFKVTGMTRPRKNLGASGIRTRDLQFSKRTH